ncbi:hypothetical protein [Thermogutta sp.]|uniref:hypothetical protein n=1 Tax=Thermogutta sp. TaxID=1962930 RepID=UPI0032206419
MTDRTPVLDMDTLAAAYSADIHLEGGDVSSACAHVLPFMYGNPERRDWQFFPTVSQEVFEYLGERMGMGNGFFVPPVGGTYFGRPDVDKGITRIVMFTEGSGGKTVIHIRSTPLTPPMFDWYPAGGGDAWTMFTDMVQAAIVHRVSFILCGATGGGKTRLLVSGIFPFLCWRGSKVLYVEFYPELAERLRREYAGPHIFLSLRSPGVGQETALPLEDVIRMARTADVNYVVFQEVYMSTGLGFGASMQHVADLAASGIPFAFTTHPSGDNAVLTARRYRETIYVPCRMLVIVVARREIQAVYSSPDAGEILIWECKPDEENGVVYRAYPHASLPEGLRGIIEAIG